MSASPSCKTCIHWRPEKPGQSVRLPGELVGQCRVNSPTSSYSWPKTKATDECGRYFADTAPVVEPLPQPTPTARAPRAPRGIEGSSADVSRGPDNRPNAKRPA